MSVEQQEETPKADPAKTRVPANPEAADERKFRRRELLVLTATLVATVAFGWGQSINLEKTLKSSTAATIYAQQQDIDKVFVDMPHLQPFFWDDKPLPAPAGDAASVISAQARGVASRILDHFEHLTYQMKAGAFEEEEDWKAYMKESFVTSPVLCLTLWDDKDEYGGTADDSLWVMYAKGNCPEVQAS
jgi:hypothetical protein